VEELLCNVEEVAACYAEAGGAEVGKHIQATKGRPDSSQEPKFFFRKPDDYRTLYSHGVGGGMKAENMLRTGQTGRDRFMMPIVIVTIAVKLWASSYRLAQQQRKKELIQHQRFKSRFAWDDTTRNVGYF
jgi:hypothetical protein